MSAALAFAALVGALFIGATCTLTYWTLTRAPRHRVALLTSITVGMSLLVGVTFSLYSTSPILMGASRPITQQASDISRNSHQREQLDRFSRELAFERQRNAKLTDVLKEANANKQADDADALIRSVIARTTEAKLDAPPLTKPASLNSTSPDDAAQLITVLTASNRGQNATRLSYLHYEAATVRVPDIHKVGQVERPTDITIYGFNRCRRGGGWN